MYASGINGAKLSAKNKQLLVSSGISSLDDLIGGGQVIGSITLLEEDSHGSYANILLKYFLAEGVVCKHNCFIASLDEDPKDIIENLPSPVETDPDPEDQTNVTEKLKIAFRYEEIPNSEKSSNKNKNIRNFDLTKKMPHSLLKECVVHTWDGDNILENSTCSFNNPAYHSLLLSIKEKLEEEKYLPIGVKQPKNIFRIALRSLGSPMWGPMQNIRESFDWESDLIKFLYCLRGLTREANVVTFITLPTYLQEPTAISRCIHNSDIALKLESFAGTDLESNPYLSEYHGFFHVTKVAAINTLTSFLTSKVEYVFQLRRKKFVIKTLHLPPDLQEVKESDQKKKSPLNLGCGSSDKHLLEF